MRRTFVVDASIAVKWTVPEAGSELAEKIRAHILLAPDLLRIEYSNVLWRLVKVGALPAMEAFGSLRDLANGPVRFHSCEPLEQDALRIALELRHPVYDCYYLALCRREGAPLVTDDRRLLEVARRDGAFRNRVLTLAEAAALAP